MGGQESLVPALPRPDWYVPGQAPPSLGSQACVDSYGPLVFPCVSQPFLTPAPTLQLLSALQLGTRRGFRTTEQGGGRI